MAPNAVSAILPMIILLGLLIFVHEMGHFLVAKYNNVKVETFSLGFGPKIFQFTRGGTVYAISALPLGGYVKMYGDDPTADIPPEMRAVSFTHKPVGQRIAVVLAGPLMNFFFAVLVFMIIAFVGEPTLKPVLGDIEPTSTAAKMGFRSGDRIVSIDSKTIETWDEMATALDEKVGSQIPVEVERESFNSSPTKTTERIMASPILAANKNVLAWKKQIGDIDGLTYFSRASVVGVIESSVAFKAGLRTGDVVVAVDGLAIEKWRQLDGMVASSIEKNSSKISLTILRDAGPSKDPIKSDITVEMSSIKPTPMGILAQIGIENPSLYLAGIEANSPADKSGLKKGDKLLSINGEVIASFDTIANRVKNFKAENGPFKLEVLRNSKVEKIEVSPRIKERTSPLGKDEKKYEIGIQPLIMDAPPATFKRSTANPFLALEHGFSQTLKWSGITVMSFVRLIQAEVSAKNIGGFISIGQMAKKSWDSGLSQFLHVMGIISINLFIINLFPVPVLDGGHLLFFSIEALRGAPLSMRKMEIAQQIGLILLLGLMVFALFNDVTRIFS